jgi:hypothetical protein
VSSGIIILIIYFLAVALTGESFISERASGLLDRSPPWPPGILKVVLVLGSYPWT